MARGRGGNLTPYERRILRRTGLLPSQARARGISLAAARGHAPRRLAPEGPVLREHQIRAIAARAAGRPTETEKAWLRRQAVRTGRDEEELQEIFMGFAPAKRDRIRELQTKAARRYRASHSRFRYDLDAPDDWGDFPDLEGDEKELMYYH